MEDLVCWFSLGVLVGGFDLLDRGYLLEDLLVGGFDLCEGWSTCWTRRFVGGFDLCRGKFLQIQDGGRSFLVA